MILSFAKLSRMLESVVESEIGAQSRLDDPAMAMERTRQSTKIVQRHMVCGAVALRRGYMSFRCEPARLACMLWGTGLHDRRRIEALRIL